MKRVPAVRTCTASVCLGFLAACFLACGGVGSGGGSRSTQSAVVVSVGLADVHQIVKANYYNQRGMIQFLAVLDNGDEARAEVSIPFEQARQLKDGAALLVKCSDGKYVDALMTIVP